MILSALIAITGASGFIGNRLMKSHLAAGDRVRILSRRTSSTWPEGVNIIHQDLGQATPDELQDFTANADIIYHCAGELRHQHLMEAVHVKGTRALLEAAIGTTKRFVLLSSVGVYGEHRSGVITENTKFAPIGPYETTKARADEMVLEAGTTSGLEIAVLRPSIVFGSGMSNRSLWAMAQTIRRGLFFFIGATGASANYIHVDNVVTALKLCGTHPEAIGKAYNLSDWRSIEDFVTLMAQNIGCTVPQRRVPEWFARGLATSLGSINGWPLTPSRVDALTVQTRYPIERIVNDLGYQHARTMEDGVRELFTGMDS